MQILANQTNKRAARYLTGLADRIARGDAVHVHPTEAAVVGALLMQEIAPLDCPICTMAGVIEIIEDCRSLYQAAHDHGLTHEVLDAAEEAQKP